MPVHPQKVYYLHINKIATAVFLTGSGVVDSVM